VSEEVPDGWVDVSLGELLRGPLRNGHSARPSLDGSGVRALTLTAVTYGEFSEKNTKMTVADPTKVADLWLEPGDLLIERSNTPELVGTARLYRGPRQWAIFPDLLIRARLLEVASPDYVEALLLSHGSRNYFMESAQGTAGSMPKIDQGVIERLRVPLPPLVEQYRIVGMVDALLAQVTATRQRLASVHLILKRFRQSVLSAACSGRLTEVWRAHHPGAAPFLARHSAGQCRVCARLTSWTPHGEDWPESWVVVPIGCLVGVATGATPLRRRRDYYEHGTIPWVKSAAVNADRITEVNEFITEAALRETNAKVFSPGTLLVAMYGEGATRGKVTELAVPAATNQALAALTFDEVSAAIRPFLKLVLKSLYSENREASAGGVQPNLSLGMIRSIRVPLPPISEQQEIVRQVEALFSLADTIDRRIAMASARADVVTQAILNKAFRGELVPTEAELAHAEGRVYESAEALLARIQAERPATAKPSKGQRSRALRASART
jgi:type I restriction enzyme S subunit